MEPSTCEDSLWPAMQHSCTACASSRIAILVSKPQMYTGSNATSLLLQLCLLRERDGLRPRVPTTLLSETVRLRPWTRVLICPELRVLRLIPTGFETRIPTGVEIRTKFRSGRTQLTHAVETNHPADNSDVWVLVTTKRVKSQVDFSPGGFSSSYMRGCLLCGKNPAYSDAEIIGVDLLSEWFKFGCLRLSISRTRRPSSVNCTSNSWLVHPKLSSSPTALPCAAHAHSWYLISC